MNSSKLAFFPLLSTTETFELWLDPLVLLWVKVVSRFADDVSRRGRLFGRGADAVGATW